MLEKKALTSVAIHDSLAQRWSTRAFNATRPVTREQQLALLEAARWSPSCHNDEPWRYLIWDKTTDPEGWQSLRLSVGIQSQMGGKCTAADAFVCGQHVCP